MSAAIHLVPRGFSLGSPSLLGKRQKALALCLYLVALILILYATAAHAQGCAQCLDNTRSAPPAVQAAYRHAIILLATTAAALFAAGTVLLRRNR